MMAVTVRWSRINTDVPNVRTVIESMENTVTVVGFRFRCSVREADDDAEGGPNAVRHVFRFEPRPQSTYSTGNAHRSISLYSTSMAPGQIGHDTDLEAKLNKASFNLLVRLCLPLGQDSL